MIVTDATNLPRLMACNGSRSMGGALPPIDEIDNTIRDQGTAAHYMAMAVFNKLFHLEELVDRKAPNGTFMTIEMLAHVDEYLKLLTDPRFSWSAVEHDTSFAGDNWRVNARADFIGYSYTDNSLVILDFKYGYNTVEVERNWTLIAHAIGFCILNKLCPDRIVFGIYQPRAHHIDGHYREWAINYLDLLELHRQVSQTLSYPNDELHTGPHCSRCPAVGNCGPAMRAGMNAIEVSGMVLIEAVSNERLVAEYNLLLQAEKTIKNLKNAREEMMKHRLKAGENLGDYTLENGLSNRQLTITDPIMLKTLTGIDWTQPGKLITPAEAERRGVSEIVLKSITTRVPTGTKLARISVQKQAERIFKRKELT